MATSDPLFPPTALLPQSDPGGVRAVMPTQSGSIRPFAATLAVAHQIDATKKHDTTATKSTYRTNSETVNDGTRTVDSVVDTEIDD